MTDGDNKSASLKSSEVITRLSGNGEFWRLPLILLTQMIVSSLNSSELVRQKNVALDWAAKASAINLASTIESPQTKKLFLMKLSGFGIFGFKRVSMAHLSVSGIYSHLTFDTRMPPNLLKIPGNALFIDMIQENFDFLGNSLLLQLEKQETRNNHSQLTGTLLPL